MAHEYDVFVSYRWTEPDQSWVRDALVPALEAAGLRVCLDVKDFIPGRDLMLEMSRAGRTSRRALCILSEDYFADNRMAHFESLNARRADPGGMDSRLVPLVLRSTAIPDWMEGLIRIDWTDDRHRAREWRKLLKVLEAPGESEPPGSFTSQASPTRSVPIFLHDCNLPRTFVARHSELSRLTRLLVDRGGAAPATRVAAVTAIGGVGKSCLCRALIERSDIAESFSRVIWFSFYEARAEAEDYFLSEVLAHGFGWKDPERPLEGAKEAARLRHVLNEALSRHNTLLILDGLEVVQFTDDPESPKYGSIKPTWSEVDKLLRHVLNGTSSVCLITSRVPLRPLEPIRGYQHVSLDLFTSIEGAQLLRSLGVAGEEAVLEACAESLGGHALSLVAAGRFMARRKVAASQLGDLVGDRDVFQRTAEGEKVKRICEWYRAELSAAQEYFLTRLSIHGRAVTNVNYPVVVLGYGGSLTDPSVEGDIIQPLVERGLVDRLESSQSLVRYSAHPLMKLAFSTWLRPKELKDAHVDWARAAEREPGLSFAVATARSLEDLQPLVEATEQYLAADLRDEAWDIYANRQVGVRLGELGYVELSMRLARRFEELRISDVNWSDWKSAMLFSRMAWLASRLENTDDAVRYRRMELDAARHGGLPNLAQVETEVAGHLAGHGFVQEAVAINPSDRWAQGVIALARGDYKHATGLLRVAHRGTSGHGRARVAQPLAEALYRGGKCAEAAVILHDALRIATEGNFTCCEKILLGHLTDLALQRNDVPEAQRWWDTRTALLRRLEHSVNSHPWLLLAQGDVSGAFAATETGGRTAPSVSARHIARARIFVHLGKQAEAIAELDAVEDAQSSSDYRELKNEVLELRKALARAR